MSSPVSKTTYYLQAVIDAGTRKRAQRNRWLVIIPTTPASVEQNVTSCQLAEEQRTTYLFLQLRRRSNSESKRQLNL